MLGSWICGNVYTRPDRKRVYGYIYDAGSEGGAGMNRLGGSPWSHCWAAIVCLDAESGRAGQRTLSYLSR